MTFLYAPEKNVSRPFLSVLSRKIKSGMLLTLKFINNCIILLYRFIIKLCWKKYKNVMFFNKRLKHCITGLVFLTPSNFFLVLGQRVFNVKNYFNINMVRSVAMATSRSIRPASVVPYYCFVALVTCGYQVSAYLNIGKFLTND